MPQPYKEHKDPDTDLNIPKTAKKSFINWVVPMLCLAVTMAIFTVVKAWADDRYERRMAAENTQAQTIQMMQDEQKKREVLDAQMQDMNRKLDLIIYILNRDGKVTPSDIKGKLNMP